MDIKGAYLNGKLKEHVYMKQPEGFDNGTGRICQLIKTLYGLKQAGHEWNIKFNSKLTKRKYKCLFSDPCMYIFHVRDDFSIVTVWVDDILIFVTSIELRDKTVADIEAKWEVTNIGKPTKIVGIEITMTSDSIAILSKQYIELILRKEGMDGSNFMSTPLDPNIALVPNPEGENRSRSNSFARLLGELQYIANTMCPDITYTVNRLASYTANPSLQHNIAVKQILRYLAGTQSHGIVYKAHPQQKNLYGYADTAYSNADNRGSTMGYVFLVADGAITWCLKKQIATALSLTEAEYVVLSESVQEACWLRSLYNELRLLPRELLTLVLGDNEGAIAMMKNPQFHKRSKHIEIHWHWV